MIEIKELLNRFDEILFSEEEKKKLVAEAVSFVIKTKINSQQVEIKNSIIYLDIKPLYKNEVFIKQKQIFLKLKEVFKKNIPKAIK